MHIIPVQLCQEALYMSDKWVFTFVEFKGWDQSKRVGRGSRDNDISGPFPGVILIHSCRIPSIPQFWARDLWCLAPKRKVVTRLSLHGTKSVLMRMNVGTESLQIFRLIAVRGAWLHSEVRTDLFYHPELTVPSKVWQRVNCRCLAGHVCMSACSSVSAHLSTATHMWMWWACDEFGKNMYLPC